MNTVTNATTRNGQTKTLWLTQIAVLIAIEFIMSMTPLGYLNVGVISISFLCIPIAIGAMVMGVGCSTILGLVFGLTSFSKSFGGAMGGIFLGISPVSTFILCVVPRVLVGLFTGLIFQGLKKVDKKGFFCYSITGACCSALNTILYMSAMILLFGQTDYLQGLMNGASVLAFVIATVGINCIVELIACCVISGSVGKILNKVLRKDY